jgi:hypothetical protein
MTCNGVSSDSHAIRNRLSGASEICNINQIDKNSTNITEIFLKVALLIQTKFYWSWAVAHDEDCSSV